MEIQIDYWFLVFLRVLRNKLQVRMHTLCTRLTSRKISYEKFTNLWTSKRLNLAIKLYKLNKSTLNQSSYVTSFNKYIIVSSSLRVPILERISPPRNCDAKKLSSTSSWCSTYTTQTANSNVRKLTEISVKIISNFFYLTRFSLNSRVLLSPNFSRNIYHQWNWNISYRCRMISVAPCKQNFLPIALKTKRLWRKLRRS